MTGFGYSEYQDEKLRLTIDVKSYNNRYLDIFVNLPPFLSPLEQRIRELIGNFAERGRIEVTVKIRELQEEIEVVLDEGAVKAYAEVLKKAAALSNVDEKLILPALVEMEGVIKIDKNRDIDSFWDTIRPELENACRQLEDVRRKEGGETLKDITRCLGEIRGAVGEIGKHADTIEDRVKETLRSRFDEVLSGQVDESRVLNETAVMLVKLSIHEELTRLEGHIDAFMRTMQSDGPCGKKLDFICQELNREINTIGSKNVILEVSQSVVDVKDSIEKIREQLRNIE
jgi:uncharacterized protein (TIGR00255 family)